MKNQGNQEIPDLTILPQPIVFFDGECNLCNRTVQFLLRHNPSGDLSFASLQSELGSGVLKMAGYKSLSMDTLLFVKGNNIYDFSTAAIKISAHLSFPFRLSGVLILIPKTVRDFIYKIIAKHRYVLFENKTCCIKKESMYSPRFLS